MLGRLSVDSGASFDDVGWAWAPAAVYEPQWSPDQAADAMARWRDTVERGLPVAGAP